MYILNCGQYDRNSRCKRDRTLQQLVKRLIVRTIDPRYIRGEERKKLGIPRSTYSRLMYPDHPTTCSTLEKLLRMKDLNVVLRCGESAAVTYSAMRAKQMLGSPVSKIDLNDHIEDLIKYPLVPVEHVSLNHALKMLIRIRLKEESVFGKHIAQTLNIEPSLYFRNMSYRTNTELSTLDPILKYIGPITVEIVDPC